MQNFPSFRLEGKNIDSILSEIDITIKNVFDAIEIVKSNPDIYRVVSISSVRKLIALPQIDMESAKEVLYLNFDDIDEAVLKYAHAKRFQAATEEDCQKALKFMKKGEKLLVHCAAGISRSPAIALGYLLSKCRDYRDAVNRLLVIRESASPNSHVLRLMCRILERESEFEEILAYIDSVKQKKYVDNASRRRKPLSIKSYFK